MKRIHTALLPLLCGNSCAPPALRTETAGARLLRGIFLCLLLVALESGASLFGQSGLQQARIVEKIDESHLVTLKGNTLPVANAQNDLGPVSPGLAMTDLVLVLRRSPEQQAAFNQFVADQYNSSSPEFHHWLDAAEAGARFGLSLSDISTIVNWLTSHGLSVTGTSKDRMSIRFSGTVGQVQSAFHTQIHQILVDGSTHIANMSDPQIPAALAPVIAGVKAGLRRVRPELRLLRPGCRALTQGLACDGLR